MTEQLRTLLERIRDNTPKQLAKQEGFFIRWLPNPNYVELEQALADLPGPSQQWQPIESAPRDGFHILLYRPQICFVGYYAAGGDWIISAPGLPVMYPAPTHWMPLPTAPNQEG